MKILHVVPSYKPAFVYGGPIESVARLCEGLSEAGHSVDVYTTTANGKTELEVASGLAVDVEGVSVTYFKRITKDHTHISPTLWKNLFLNCKKYDVVHIHSWWNPLVMIAALLLNFRKVNVIVSPRGMLSSYIINTSNSKIKKVLHFTIGKKALKKSIFHATAQSEFEECKKIISNWNGFMLPNILSLPNVEIDKSNNDVFTLIFLSRIHPKKGIELLLESIKEIPFDIKLKIAGTGEEDYLNLLRLKADEIQVSDKIEWLGWKSRDEKFIELMKSDLFVLTSYNENFANVVIESLHVGTPVLISEEVGLSSYVIENDLGWVTKLDKESIKNSIIEAYKDKKKREKINKEGRGQIEKHYSEKVLTAKYIESYKTLKEIA